MPIYDFKCAECGHKFTALVSINERDKVICPDCGAKKVEQLITGCMVRTGGGGNCDLPTTGGGYGGG